MKKILISSAVVAAVVLILSTTVYSEPRTGGDRPMRRHLMDYTMDGKGFAKISDKLNLTQDQKDKIDDLRTSHQKKMIDLRSELQKARLDARDFRNSDNISRSDGVKSVERINKIENEIALLRVNHRMDIYELLTPEQKQAWKEFRNDFPRHKMWNKKGFKRNSD
jgi:Spy/CpxP family protein refolding chaperone